MRMRHRHTPVERVDDLAGKRRAISCRVVHTRVVGDRLGEKLARYHLDRVMAAGPHMIVK